MNEFIDLFSSIEESVLMSATDMQVIAATENSSRQKMEEFKPRDPIGMALRSEYYYDYVLSKSSAIEAASHLMSLLSDEWKSEDDLIHYKWIQRISLWITHADYRTIPILELMFDLDLSPLLLKPNRYWFLSSLFS